MLRQVEVLVVGGREYALDCLVYGTGFEVGTDFTRRLGFQVQGRDGLTLTEKWRQGASTFHGLFTRGFPKLFVMTTQQSGQSANFQHMLDEPSRHIAHILCEVKARGPTAFIRLLDEWRQAGTLPGLEVTALAPEARSPKPEAR